MRNEADPVIYSNVSENKLSELTLLVYIYIVVLSVSSRFTGKHAAWKCKAISASAPILW